MMNQLTATRLAALRELLRERGLDGLLVAGPDNRRYLSGFTAREELVHESCGVLLITAEAALLFTDFRYQEWALAEASDYEVLVYKAGLGVALAEQLAVLGLARLGFESAYLSVAQHQRLREAAVQAGLKVKWQPVEGLVEGLREIKTPEEVAAIRAALALTEAVFAEVAAALRPGLTEARVAWEIERRLREESAEVLAFPPIVAAGPNAARPHHRPGDYALKAGEPIIIDLGARREGYCADLTRTVMLGPPTEQFREIYTLVRRAQARAEAGLRAGLDSVAADALARDLIREAGHGPAFGHSLGHGVGLAVHELPSLSPLEERRTVLQAGSIVTVEPGIYLSGWGGVRLEDMAHIREDGADILNRLGFYEF